MKPVDVSERVEFLSDGWIDVARRYLQDAVDTDARPGHREQISICESFTDAPPGLGLPDDRAVWYFSLDDGRVDVGRGELPGADLRVDGDYQTTLSIAQTVYAAGPEAVERAPARAGPPRRSRCAPRAGWPRP